MKVLKWLGIILGILFIIFLIFTGTQPNQLKVERTMTMNASSSQVFKIISDFKTWGEWSAWNKMDPNMEVSYEGEMGTVGAKTIWSSENPMVGKGSQEITELEKDKYLKSVMLFNGQAGLNYAWFTLEDDGNGGTVVTWSMEGAETSFMMNWQNTVFKPMIEQSYDQSLKDLKDIVEAMPVEIANPLGLQIMDIEAMAIVSIKDSTTADGIGDKLTELYTELSIYLATDDNASSAGMPLAMYYLYSPDKVILEAAIPYTGEATANGRMMVKETPGGQAVKGIHYGAYEASGDMHEAIHTYGKAKGVEFREMCWEIYANDPTTVDSAAVETHIVYPVQ